MRHLLLLAAAACGVMAAAFAADGSGTSSMATIDTTDHGASWAVPVLDARAGAAANSAEGVIDTAMPLGTILVVR